MSTILNSKKSKGKKSRGQVLTIDLVLSLTVFLAAFFILFYLWQMAQKVSVLNTHELEMSKLAVIVAHSLVFAQGQPSNWHAMANPADASSFGLAWRSNVLQQEKVDAFIALNATNYTSTKERLGAGRYELYIFVQDLAGANIYEFGIKPPDSSRIHPIQVAQRFAILNNEPIIVQAEVWSNIYS